MGEYKPDTGKEIREIEREIDIPPASLDKNTYVYELTPREKRELHKWFTNLNFIKLILAIMGLMYVIDIVVSIMFPNVSIGLKDSLFEALKMLLFTASGYVFAKTNSET